MLTTYTIKWILYNQDFIQKFSDDPKLTSMDKFETKNDKSHIHFGKLVLSAFRH